MGKKSIFIFILSLLCSTIKANKLFEDSLWNVWSNIENTTFDRLEALSRLSKDVLLTTNPDSAYYFSTKIVDLALKSKDTNHLAVAFNIKGIYFAQKSEYNNAIKNFENALQFYNAIGDINGKANALNNLGLIKQNQGDYLKAIQYFTNSLYIYEKIDNKKNIASSQNNIGLVFLTQGDLLKAEEYFNKSLATNKLINHKLGAAACLNNLGLIYFKKGLNEKSIFYYKKSYNIVEQLGDKNKIASSLNNIGEVYFSNKDFSNAYAYFKQSMHIKEATGNKQGLAATLINIGNIHEHNKEISEALLMYNKALKIAQDIGADEEIKNAAEKLYDVYQKLGKYELALQMHKLYIEKRIQAENLETQKSILQKEWLYKLEKEQLADSLAVAEKQKIDQLNQKKTTQNRYFIYTIISLVLLVIAIYIRSVLVKNKLEQEKLIEEIKLLKSDSVVKKVLSMSIVETPSLNKKQIDNYLGVTLNQTDWNILSELFNNPALSNKELSDKVSMSIEGTRSSLGKMYRLFNVKTGRNQRFMLVMEAAKVSNIIN